MKIALQSSDQMALQDSNIGKNVFIGIILIGISAYGTYYLFGADGQSAWRAMWLPGIGVLVGLIMIFAATSISVLIDKAQGQIVFTKKWIWRTKNQTQNVADAVRVELRRDSYRQSDSNQRGFSAGGQQVMESQTVIVFRDGTEMPLENVKKRGGGSSLIGAGVLMAGGGKELSISEQVATFIGVPFQEMGGGTPQMNIGTPGGGISL